MRDWDLVTRSDVLAAMEEHDQLGSREFLRRYGFGRARSHVLWHRGQEYAPMAILGAAYLHATGKPSTSAQFSDGEQAAAKALMNMGFDVVAEEEPVTTTKRTAKPKPKPAAKKAEPVLQVCPRCFTALPATGVCDYCD